MIKDEHAVSSPVEVGYILQELIRTRELLNVAFNQGSMTTLLLHAERSQNVLVFDGSADKTINRDIVGAARIVFSGSLRGTRVEFACTAAREVRYHGAAALAAKLPASIRRVQNRESFRVKTAAASCTLPMPGRGYVTVPVSEVSVGGALVMLDHASDVFHVGQMIDCQLKLAAGTLRCKLEVRGFKRVGRLLGMGCRFVGLPRGEEALLARFVSQQERDTLSRGAFFGR